jgi:hypothetical protein
MSSDGILDNCIPVSRAPQLKLSFAFVFQAYRANQQRLGYVIVIFCEFRDPHLARN